MAGADRRGDRSGIQSHHGFRGQHLKHRVPSADGSRGGRRNRVAVRSRDERPGIVRGLIRRKSERCAHGVPGAAWRAGGVDCAAAMGAAPAGGTNLNGRFVCGGAAPEDDGRAETRRIRAQRHIGPGSHKEAGRVGAKGAVILQPAAPAQPRGDPILAKQSAIGTDVRGRGVGLPDWRQRRGP